MSAVNSSDPTRSGKPSNRGESEWLSWPCCNGWSVECKADSSVYVASKKKKKNKKKANGKPEGGAKGAEPNGVKHDRGEDIDEDEEEDESAEPGVSSLAKTAYTRVWC